MSICLLYPRFPGSLLPAGDVDLELQKITNLEDANKYLEKYSPQLRIIQEEKGGLYRLKENNFTLLFSSPSLREILSFLYPGRRNLFKELLPGVKESLVLSGKLFCLYKSPLFWRAFFDFWSKKRYTFNRFYLLKHNFLMNMSSYFHRTLSAFFLLFSIIGLGTNVSVAQSVPAEYYPNYAIQDDFAKVQEAFVVIEAAQKMGDLGRIDSATFAQINASFKRLFPAFPQEYNFKVVYQQCLNLSSDLSSNRSTLKFQTFINNCYKPLSTILSQISSKYTVKVAATRNPTTGPAPLTVTFDARSSTDPSMETIPSKNFFWYYRDTKGVDRVMGIGNVINYTFQEAGNYQIHLTVRSSNVSQGILDGEMTLSVNVSPKAANIVVYANQRKLDSNKAIKIGTQEAKKGVTLDGSATMPMGGRKIQSHQWNISSTDGFKFSKAGDGNPGYINVPFNGNGEYKVTLSTTDNENNTVSEVFSIIVSDPVAIIKQTPAVGTTSTLFTFDSNASYSLVSRLKLYVWEVFNSDGDKIDTVQGRTLKRQFIKPGTYLVRLTVEDELGQSNVDVAEVYVSSSAPTPQFTITSTNKRTESSEFYLDAGGTTDVDVTNGFDALEYKREFSNPRAAKIVSTENNNQQVVVQFDEIGTHVVKLTVTDMYGETSTIEKQIVVKSILRPELTITPGAVTRGRTVSFAVRTNVPIVGYTWNFGDGSSVYTQEGATQHVYKSVGIYNVSVQVVDEDGNINTISEKMFIGQIDTPITAFRVKNSKGFYLPSYSTNCSYQSGNETIVTPAYTIDRYQSITIDPSLSVNAQGTHTNLAFYFRPKQGELYQQNTFTHKFNEIGCQFIDLTVEDKSLGKFDTLRIWFKVTNALPTLKNLVLSFPQYGNESGIGFQVNSTSTQNILDVSSDSSSTLMVKVSAVGATDPDGNISYFKWYYYPKDNPNQIIETRITPSNVPYVFFTLPRIAGEYMFGVAIYDDDNAYQKSESIIGNGPTILFPQTDGNPNIPIVTLKFDKQTVEVGEEVNFDVIARVTSDSDDFYANRTIQYDFDGDGEWDLVTTKDRVTHVYTEPNEKGYTPKAAVIYRGYKGISETRGNTLVVKTGVKPILAFNSIKTIAIFRDLSIGNLIYRQVCFDAELCAAGDRQYLKTHVAPVSATLGSTIGNPILQNRAFLQQYPTLGSHKVTLNIKSNLGVTVAKELTIQLSNNVSNGRITSGLNLITIPETSFNNADPEIYVASTMDNSVLFYLHYEGTGTCFIDTDISVDSNHDGKTDNDVDILCNALTLQEYTPQFDNIIGRMYFEHAGKVVYKNFSVTFEAYEDNLMDEETQALYKDISTLYNGIEDSSNGNADLRVLLDTLRRNLLDKNQTSANLVMIQTHLKESMVTLDQNQKDLLDSIIARLSTSETIAVMGGTEYDQAKNEILAGVPAALRSEVARLFSEFEADATSLDDLQKRERLTEILNFIATNAEANGISRADLDNFFLIQFCKILDYYNLTSEACSALNGDTTVTPAVSVTTEDTERSGLPVVLKVILWIIFGGIAVMGGVVVFFAVKAKMKASAEADEDEEE